MSVASTALFLYNKNYRRLSFAIDIAEILNYKEEDTMRVGMLTSGGDCQSLNATMRGVAKTLYNQRKDVESLVSSKVIAD